LVETGLALKFVYSGKVRRIDNFTWEPETRTIIGYEMTKNGQFSYKIKRYSYDKMSDLELIPSFIRKGPKIGR
jgi:hypothetical protein